MAGAGASFLSGSGIRGRQEEVNNLTDHCRAGTDCAERHDVRFWTVPFDCERRKLVMAVDGSRR